MSMSATMDSNILKDRNYEDFIKKSLKKEGYEVKKIENVAKLTQQGFMASVYSFDAVVEINSEKRTLKLIAKITNDDEELRKVAPIESFAVREVLVFNSLLPKLKKFEREKHVKDTFEISKCYGASDERLKEIVIMEDLRTAGYEPCRSKLLDLKHTVLFFKKMARLHATFFLFKNEYPAEFAEISKDYIDLLYLSERNVKPMHLFECYKNIKNVSEEIRQFVDFVIGIENVEEKLKIRSDGRSYKYSTLCHGDPIANNSLFLYKGQTPTKMILLDWQTVRCASPVSDLLFCIFISVEPKLRKEQFGMLTNLYYMELYKVLMDLGANPGEIYPKEIFEKDLKSISLQVVFSALLLIPIFYSVKNNDESELNDIGLECILQMKSDIVTNKLNELW